MPTLFISDLHLELERPDLTALFFGLLKKYAGKVDALYILGDLFEVWVGDDDDTPYHASIISALHAFAQSGSGLYFLPGNRDFLIGRRFCKKSGCKLLKDPTLINLYGEPVLLLHGDSLCTRDLKHMAFRKKTRNFLFKKLLLLKSLAKRREIGQQVRRISKNHTQKLDEYLMDVTFSEITRLFKKHKTLTMIHGHTHRPSIEYFRHGDQFGSRFVLSDWEKQASVLICDQNSKRLVFLSEASL